SAAASHRRGSTRPEPPGPAGSSTSRHRPPTSSQRSRNSSGFSRPNSSRSDAGRRKSPALTTTAKRPRTRSTSATRSASVSGRVGGGPSTARRTRPGWASTSSATSSTSRSGVTGVICTGYWLLPVPLHDVGGALLRAVRVETGAAARVALPQQVPVAVQLDRQLVQPLLLRLRERLAHVGALEPVLLRHQLADPAVQFIVVHPGSPSDRWVSSSLVLPDTRPRGTGPRHRHLRHPRVAGDR